jgi:signal transduction histidine kinase
MTRLRTWFALACAMAGICIGSTALAREPVIRLAQLGAEGSLVVGRYLAQYEDATSARGIEWVSAPPQAVLFSTSQSDRPNFSYSSSAHWLRFSIDPTGSDIDLLLEVGQPSLDHIELYSPVPGGGFAMQSGGDRVAWGVRKIAHRNHVFRVSAPMGAPATFYLRLASTSAVMAPLTLWRASEFEAASRLAQLLLGMFYGLLAAQCLYNLFLYFTLRDRAYLLYIGYVAAFGLSLFVLDGLAFEYLWPDQVLWANRALPTLLFATFSLGALFAREFLDPRKYAPVADHLVKWFAVLAAVMMGCAASGLWFEFRQLFHVLTWFTLFIVPLTLWIAFRAIANGYRPARYFLLAWTALLGFLLFSALRNLALAPVNFFSAYGLHIGLALDVILLSTALADRIRALREEMIAAQARLISASRQYQDVLERRAAELAAANLELENFSHTVAHDLRSPLRAIDGFAHLVTEEIGAKLGPDSRRDLGLISQNARRMAQLIDGLLDFSRIGRITPGAQRVDMGELAQAVAQELNSDGRTDVRIDALPFVKGDAMLLRQVWANLLGNAIKFSANNAVPTVVVRCEAGTDGAVFSVRDNGAGFDMQYADKLFGMFQRLHNPSEFEGTGVGLAIVKRVVERHGGRVWATGIPGEGATFHFSIPAERLAENP